MWQDSQLPIRTGCSIKGKRKLLVGHANLLGSERRIDRFHAIILKKATTHLPVGEREVDSVGWRQVLDNIRNISAGERVVSDRASINDS